MISTGWFLLIASGYFIMPVRAQFRVGTPYPPSALTLPLTGKSLVWILSGVSCLAGSSIFLGAFNFQFATILISCVAPGD